ncbi:hypothetical protein ACLBW8_15970 [Pseudomonas sp. M5A4_2d]
MNFVSNVACHFEAILALLDGYAIWLQSGRQADNLVARIGKAETAPFPQIDPRTRDQYLRLLKQYLSWCVTRYIPRARRNSATHADSTWYLPMSPASLSGALNARRPRTAPRYLVAAL